MAEERRRALRRLAWFVCLWAAGVAVVGGSVLALRTLFGL